jgi:hypothetical protein
MSEEELPLTSLPSYLYLKDFPRVIQDNGKVKLGGGFSSLSKPPISKCRQPHRVSDMVCSNRLTLRPGNG